MEVSSKYFVTEMKHGILLMMTWLNFAVTVMKTSLVVTSDRPRVCMYAQKQFSLSLSSILINYQCCCVSDFYREYCFFTLRYISLNVLE